MSFVEALRKWKSNNERNKQIPNASSLLRKLDQRKISLIELAVLSTCKKQNRFCLSPYYYNTQDFLLQFA